MIGSALLDWVVGITVVAFVAGAAAVLVAIDTVLRDHDARRPVPLEATATAGAPQTPLYDQAADEELPAARQTHPDTEAAIQQAIALTQPANVAHAAGLHLISGGKR